MPDEFELEWNEEAFMIAANQVNRIACERAAIHLQGKVTKALSKLGTGRIYHRRGIEHRASAPGHPPAVDTGALRASIDWFVEHVRDAITAWIGPNEDALGQTAEPDYGYWLEIGTRRMLPRPYLWPTLLKEAPVIRKIFAEANS